MVQNEGRRIHHLLRHSRSLPCRVQSIERGPFLHRLPAARFIGRFAEVPGSSLLLSGLHARGDDGGRLFGCHGRRSTARVVARAQDVLL